MITNPDILDYLKIIGFVAVCLLIAVLIALIGIYVSDKRDEKKIKKIRRRR